MKDAANTPPTSNDTSALAVSVEFGRNTQKLAAEIVRLRAENEKLLAAGLMAFALAEEATAQKSISTPSKPAGKTAAERLAMEFKQTTTNTLE